MILPRKWIPQRFTISRIEGALLSAARPTLPHFKIVKTYKERVKNGNRAMWFKKAKLRAQSL